VNVVTENRRQMHLTPNHLAAQPRATKPHVGLNHSSKQHSSKQHSSKQHSSKPSGLDVTEGVLSAAIEALQDSFFVTDTIGTIQYVNRATEQLFRHNAPSLIGSPFAHFAIDASFVPSILRQAQTNGWQGELLLRRGSGYSFTADLRATAVRNDVGQIIGISFVVRDITAQKQREAELEKANRVKSDFLAYMSHELRTPLTAILGFSSVLQKQIFGLLNPKQDQYVAQIHRSGQHLLSLINDVLDLSKIEAGQMELEVESVSVNEVCQSAIELLSEQARLRNLTIHCENLVPDLALEIDELRVRQVLVNLLANAIKFSHDDGALGIRVKHLGRMVAIEVWDQGIGIPDDQKHRLFQPFQQMETAHQRMGTGLGLALSRRLVELHEGYITVESVVGEGSCFTVHLPLPATMAIAA
jgi:PAS domain S-box-containing protein